MKKIVFLTGTRADFGKMKSLLLELEEITKYEVYIFVTGMHMLQKYGSTYEEIEKCNFKNIYKYINQNESDSMDSVLAKTVQGFSDFIKEMAPDMIVVHGDRIEALAGSIVGSLNNILVSHIEGGEVSGTVDGLIRHAVTKMSHLHFVANDEARTRLLQLGEANDTIYIIGSPDMDILASPDLPTLTQVKERYDIDFNRYMILLYHPVTTELAALKQHVKDIVDVVIDDSDTNYVVIYPNNDPGSDFIFNEYERFKELSRIKMFPSMRFEYFLTLLENADCIIGNSSAGIMEAPYFGVPCINIGTRQMNRASSGAIIHSGADKNELSLALLNIAGVTRVRKELYGNGKSQEMFVEVIEKEETWQKNTQKYFVDLGVND